MTKSGSGVILTSGKRKPSAIVNIISLSVGYIDLSKGVFLILYSITYCDFLSEDMIGLNIHQLTQMDVRLLIIMIQRFTIL